MKEEMKKRTVLYIEDDKKIHKKIVNHLNRLFKKVIATDNCEDGLHLYHTNDDIDIIITDIFIDKPESKIDGLDMVREIRKYDRHTPILITTAYDNRKNLLRGIDLHLDGFLIKVFTYKKLGNKLLKIDKILLDRENEEEKKIEELEERIRKRIENELFERPILEISKTITYDPNNRTFKREEANLRITSTQAILFELLYEFKNEIVTFTTIDNEFYNANIALRALVCALKSRLKQNFSDIIIKNIHGEGYRLKC